jgi:hypothetical protein
MSTVVRIGFLPTRIADLALFVEPSLKGGRLGVLFRNDGNRHLACPARIGAVIGHGGDGVTAKPVPGLFAKGFGMTFGQ